MKRILRRYDLFKVQTARTPAGKLTQIPSYLGSYTSKEEADSAVCEAVREWEANGSPEGVSFRIEPFYQ